MKHVSPTIEPSELAELGNNHVAYVRKLKPEDVAEFFPEAKDVPQAEQFWVLFSANGSPLMLADDQQAVFADAWEHNLLPVSVH